jgi:hypothetical protein
MIARTLLVGIALLHLAPGIVAVMPARSVALYGIALAEPALAVVMRHRAVLLASVGAGLVGAVLDARLWTAACVLAATSKLSLLAIYALEGSPAGPLRRVALADAISLVALALAALLGPGR